MIICILDIGDQELYSRENDWRRVSKQQILWIVLDMSNDDDSKIIILLQSLPQLQVDKLFEVGATQLSTSIDALKYSIAFNKSKAKRNNGLIVKKSIWYRCKRMYSSKLNVFDVQYVLNIKYLGSDRELSRDDIFVQIRNDQ